MHTRTIRALTTILAAAALLSACESVGHGGGPGEPPLPEPVVPPGYTKIPPAPADDSRQMLAQTASVVRAVLKDVRFTYDECSGPRTQYVFGDATTLIGTPVAASFTLGYLGGPTPRGTWVRVSEIPPLALDGEYVLFLRNTDWTFSPVVGNLAFRRETVAGREVLIDPNGHALTGWNDAGPTISGQALSEPVGTRLRGYRSTDATARKPPRTSDDADPRADVRPAGPNPPTPAPDRSGDSAFAQAPSAAEIRRLGLFEKPALSPAALGNEEALSIDAMTRSIRAEAEKSNVTIGGRVSVVPYWRCWNYTRTARIAR